MTLGGSGTSTPLDCSSGVEGSGTFGGDVRMGSGGSGTSEGDVRMGSEGPGTSGGDVFFGGGISATASGSIVIAMMSAAASPSAAQEEASTSRELGPSSPLISRRTRYRPASSRRTAPVTSSGVSPADRSPSRRSISRSTSAAWGQLGGAVHRSLTGLDAATAGAAKRSADKPDRSTERVRAKAMPCLMARRRLRRAFMSDARARVAGSGIMPSAGC